jgi:hypothetical protein
MNRKLGVLSSEGKRKRKLDHIQLAIVARENKTQFPFIVFDKKLGKYAKYTFYDINLEFKTLY